VKKARRAKATKERKCGGRKITHRSREGGGKYQAPWLNSCDLEKNWGKGKKSNNTTGLGTERVFTGVGFSKIEKGDAGSYQGQLHRGRRRKEKGGGVETGLSAGKIFQELPTNFYDDERGGGEHSNNS